MTLTANEDTLLSAVTNTRLNLCLQNFRFAVESLWENGAPRLVKDFTDHGIRHYERIAKYTGDLLSTNSSSPLSSTETFLLLSGVYLHDVGMQCDVTTEDGKQIKKLAEEISAKFNEEESRAFANLVFTATGANNYSLDEQKAIRKNHHYLSAAWIQYAHETGRTALGSAARQIEEDLVPDLMDVCLHHTSIPIEKCPMRIIGGGADRKRLVAALLRFADELDIDSNRVEIEAITNFSINPENAVFWWLHNQTRVTFNLPNVFRINVRLRKQDYDEFTPIVQAIYLDRFRQKNQPVLDILQSQGFPVYLDANGGVIELNSVKALPDPIRQALRSLGGSLSSPT